MKATKSLTRVIVTVLVCLAALLSASIALGFFAPNKVAAEPVAAAEEVHQHEWSHDDATKITADDFISDGDDLTGSVKLTDGNYYLDEDITIKQDVNRTATVLWIETGTVNLCLNGHKIDGNGPGTVERGTGGYAIIKIDFSTATLNLYDCDESHGSYEIENPVTHVTETIKGGLITGAFGTGGHGVSLSGTFNMYGGSIAGNGSFRPDGYPMTNGAGVYINNAGNFNMYGGSISYNIGDSTVYPSDGYSSSFKMAGGTVIGNYSSTGTILMKGFEMSGGTITGNLINSDFGGSVYLDESFKLSGNVNITGNINKQSKPADYYILWDWEELCFRKINIAGNLDSNARIGVLPASYEDMSGAFTEGLKGKGTAENFVSNDPLYYVDLNSDGEAVFIKKVHKHEDVIFDNIITSDGGYISGGNYFIDEDVTLKYTLTISGTVNLCLNGHKLDGMGNKRVITLNYGATLNLYDCEGDGRITGGNAAQGGGVNVQAGTFNMYGGTISGNQSFNGSYGAMGMGGGVYAGAGGTFTMYGGKISGNTATAGGGVYVSGIGSYSKGGTFTMYGGTISNNKADECGGVYIRSDAVSNNADDNNYPSKFVIGGNVNITGNTLSDDTTASNVYLSSGKVINITDALGSDAKIGVTLEDSVGTFTSGLSDKGTIDNFTSDNPVYSAISTADDEARLAIFHKHEDVIFDNIITSDGGEISGGNYFLNEDIKLTTDLTISGTVNICLNGHKLDGSGNDSVITISAKQTLNLYDCEGSGKIIAYGAASGVAVGSGTFTMYGGTIKDGSAFYGGGVNVGSGMFTMCGGMISDSTSPYGGVYVDGGMFTMSGGTISGNITAAPFGSGGVCVKGGTFTMTGGDISDNHATSNKGGGVYVDGGIFIMSGGTISGNSAKYGGGVYVNDGTFNVCGNVNITGNTLSDDTTASNVYLSSGKVINITDALGSDAKIGVTLQDGVGTFTDGLSGKGKADNFDSDDENYIVMLNGDEAEITTYRAWAEDALKELQENFVDKGLQGLVGEEIDSEDMQAALDKAKDAVDAYDEYMQSEDAHKDLDNIGAIEDAEDLLDKYDDYLDLLDEYNDFLNKSGDDITYDDKQTADEFDGKLSDLLGEVKECLPKNIADNIEWAQNCYKVTLDDNGDVSYINAHNGDEVVIPTLTKVGYGFDGWFTSAEGGDKFTQEKWALTEDITLYARFTANVYSITYNADGGDTSELVATHTYGTATTLGTIGKDGYDFVGWHLKSDLTDEVITVLGATAFTADITLYAEFKAKSSGDNPNTPDNPNNPDNPSDNPSDEHTESKDDDEHSMNLLWLILDIILGAVIIGELVFIFVKRKKDNKTATYGVAPLFLLALPAADIAGIAVFAVLAAAALGLGIYIVYMLQNKKNVPTEQPIAEQPAEQANAEQATEQPEEHATEQAASEQKSESVDEQQEQAQPPTAPEKEDAPDVETELKAIVENGKTRYIVIRYSKSFLAKLIQSDDQVKRYYSELKNYLLSYSGIKSKISWKHEAFRIGRQMLVKLRLRGKTLSVCLALNAADYAETKYHVEDMSDIKSLAKTPCLYRIKNDRRFNYAKELIDTLMDKWGIAKNPTEEEVDYASQYPYETTDMLLGEKLIKILNKQAQSGVVFASRANTVLQSVSAQEVDSIMQDDVASTLIVQSDSKSDRTKSGIINIDTLSQCFTSGENVTLKEIKKRVKGFNKNTTYIKVLARGTLDKPLIIEADSFSLQAVKMIVLTGGTAIKKR